MLGWGEKIWVGEFRENERGGCLVGEGREVENGGEGVFSLGPPFKSKSFFSNLTIK